MNITHAPISSKKNFMMNRPTTTITKENATNQLKSLLLYSLINTERDFPIICTYIANQLVKQNVQNHRFEYKLG